MKDAIFYDDTGGQAADVPFTIVVSIGGVERIRNLMAATLASTGSLKMSRRKMSHSDSFLPFGPAGSPNSEDHSIEDLPPELRRAGRDAYRQAWDEYCKADCPFGPEDKAMLVWFLFSRRHAQTVLTVSKN